MMSKKTDIDDLSTFISIRNLVINSILPKYIKPFMKKQYYPVVIGGYDVMRCTHNLLSIETSYTDIDLAFVIVRSPTAAILKEVKIARKRLMMQVINDDQVQNQMGIHGVRLVLDESKSETHKARLVQLVLEIKQNRICLMDAPIFASDTIVHFTLYQKFFPKNVHLRRPIPIFMYNGVPYATCNYLYYDTIRMMSYYNNEYTSAKTQKDKQYNFEKHLSYAIKYIALYNELQKKNDRSALKLFAGFQHLLEFTHTDGLSQEHLIIYNKIMNKLSRIQEKDHAIIKVVNDNK